MYKIINVDSHFLHNCGNTMLVRSFVKYASRIKHIIHVMHFLKKDKTRVKSRLRTKLFRWFINLLQHVKSWNCFRKHKNTFAFAGHQDGISSGNPSSSSWRASTCLPCTLIPAWISNHMHSKAKDEITYTFPNFNGATVEVWKGISNYIPHWLCAFSHFLALLVYVFNVWQ